MQEDALVDPPAIYLCLVERYSGPQTERHPAGQGEIRTAMGQNGPFWNEAPVWHAHLHRLARLLARAECYHLRLGTDPAGLLTALDPLFP